MLCRTTAHKVRTYFCFARRKTVGLGERCKLAAPIGLRHGFDRITNARFLLSGMSLGGTQSVHIRLAIGHERIAGLTPTGRHIARRRIKRHRLARRNGAFSQNLRRRIADRRIAHGARIRSSIARHHGARCRIPFRGAAKHMIVFGKPSLGHRRSPAVDFALRMAHGEYERDAERIQGDEREQRQQRNAPACGKRSHNQASRQPEREKRIRPYEVNARKHEAAHARFA